MYILRFCINFIELHINIFPQEEKLRVDEEEAKYQAEQRRKAIERAKTMLYYRTDRVKAFHVRIHAFSRKASALHW